ncbi:MAG: hypothetical protein ITG02_01140 [Patulibacter sp.]|nr:hypothetical protein [Patulibacter sp.]
MPPIVHGEPDDEWDDDLEMVFEKARPVGGADQLADAFANQGRMDRELAEKQRRAERRNRKDIRRVFRLPRWAVRVSRRRRTWREQWVAGLAAGIGFMSLAYVAEAAGFGASPSPEVLAVAGAANLAVSAAIMRNPRGDS